MTANIARICERWTLQFDGEPPWDGEHLTAQWLALASLVSVYGPDDIGVVYEEFPRYGVGAVMAAELFQPAWHLTRKAPGAYADLHLLDYPDLTAWATKTRMPHRLELDAVFSTNPLAVVLTDSAGAGMALPSNRQRWEGVLGRGACATYARYLMALLDRLEALYGYVLCRGYWHDRRAVLALVPADLAPSVCGLLRAVPDTPVGLELF